jgi:hypothetical protein
MTHLEIVLMAVVVLLSVSLVFMRKAVNDFQKACDTWQSAFNGMKASFDGSQTEFWKAHELIRGYRQEAIKWREVALKQKGEHD